MEEYPEYVFGCSQPQQYAWMEGALPDHLRRHQEGHQARAMGTDRVDVDRGGLQSLVGRGVGSPDSAREEFFPGRIWLRDGGRLDPGCLRLQRVDAADHEEGGNQLLRDAEDFLEPVQSLSAPHVSLGGASTARGIFSHFPPADTYNADFSPAQLLYNVHNFKENDRASRSLYVLWFWRWRRRAHQGNAGDRAARWKPRGASAGQAERVADFLVKAEKDAKDLPTWVGELYLELHRGTYTTQARNKRSNRKCEFALRDAEFFDVIASRPRLSGATWRHVRSRERSTMLSVRRRIRRRAFWIAPGSCCFSINFTISFPDRRFNWVYQDSARDYATIGELAGAVLDPAQAGVVAAIDTSAVSTAGGCLQHDVGPRQEVVSLPGGSRRVVSVPPCGYAGGRGEQETGTPSGKPVEVSSKGEFIGPG